MEMMIRVLDEVWNRDLSTVRSSPFGGDLSTRIVNICNPRP